MNRKHQLLLIAGLCLVVTGFYLLTAHRLYHVGFPLDDAWIHQTFARNLIELGEWSFNPGDPTSGSTSPLWTLLLTPAYIFGNISLAYTFLLGYLLLIITSYFLVSSILHAWPSRNLSHVFLIFTICGMEWHLIWSAVSGMETILFTAIISGVFYLLTLNPNKLFILGFLTGLAVWTRPEGITLFGPVLFIIIFEHWKNWRELVRRIFIYLGLSSLFIFPYLLFNYELSGTIWPNTLLAKQMEYQVFMQTSIIFRYLTLFITPLIGSSVLLLPGFFLWIIQTLQSKNFRAGALYLWLFGFILIYSVKLPVTYQHARYLIPIIPVYIGLSLPGMIEIYNKYIDQRVGRVFGNAWVIATIIVNIGFAYLGSKAYATDVAIIETEMVEPSKWINLNTDETTIIAAHDIGALGYFGKRKVIDLAGLVNHEVIPIINDPQNILEYVKASNADLLMIFPGWYGEPFYDPSESIYTGHYYFAINSGGERMQIFPIK